MDTKRTLKIGDMEFKTKKESYTYTRNLINRLGAGDVVKETDEWKFLAHIALMDGDLSGYCYDDITDIYLYTCPQTLGTLHMKCMVWDKNAPIHIAWARRARFLPPNSADNKLNCAMRKAVFQHCFQYKVDNNDSQVCSECNGTENIQVDHVIPFSNIKHQFLTLNTEHPSEFDRDVTNACIFREDDIEFANKWREYHNSTAIYQFLCRTCNIKKGSKIISNQRVYKYNIKHDIAKKNKIKRIQKNMEKGRKLMEELQSN